MGASDWTDGEWCGPVSVRELRSGWRFLLRKRSSRGSLPGNHCRCYCRTVAVTSCRLMDPHSHSVHERTLKWTSATFHWCRSICETTVEINLLFQLPYDNVDYSSVIDCTITELDTYLVFVLSQFGCLSRVRTMKSVTVSRWRASWTSSWQSN